MAEVDLGLKALQITDQQQLDRLRDQRELVNSKLANAEEERDLLNVQALAAGQKDPSFRRSARKTRIRARKTVRGTAVGLQL